LFDTVGKVDYNPLDMENYRLYFPHIEDVYLHILLIVRIAHCFSHCQEVQDFSGLVAE
jgi:hypothetical protein